MKKMNLKRAFAAIMMVLTVALMMTVPTFAEGPDFSDIVDPVVELLQSVLNALLVVVGAVGAIYCVFLGIKFAKAEEPQDREKAKSHLKNAIIGFVLIFVLMLALRLLMPVMEKWVSDNDDPVETAVRAVISKL